jgi:aspartate ammonia-lyase
MRTEKDSLGTRDVPDDAYYGIHTSRSLENFGACGERLPREIIHGMLRIKRACASANLELGLLPDDKAAAIRAACDRALRGEFDDHFVVDIFQAGSGTSSNMNVNEVLANVACESLGGARGDRSLVHPNDDVNKAQSTNNVFPSGIRVAAVELCGGLLDSLSDLRAELRAKGREFASVVKSGRTHLRDAVPITLGQEFDAYARALEKDAVRIESARDDLYELGVGGTAVGTGLNTHTSFRSRVIKALCEATGKPYRVAADGIEATQFLTDIAQMSSALKALSLDLLKVANDLRLLSSGPNTGLAEIALPPVEPGSSIMPGKINPSICEAANMACLQVIGNDTVVSMACGLGQLELNTHMPVAGANLVKSFRILERCCSMLARSCINGITAEPETCADYCRRSAGLATVLNPRLGYDRVAELVKESATTGRNLRELILARGILTEDQFEALVCSSTAPNLGD